MLFMLMQLGADRYAIAAREVLEILPLVEFRRLPHTPPEVAGLFVYRGIMVPALDLCQLATGEPAQSRLSTRIVLVDYRPGKPLGLIAEHVTETLRREPADFQRAGVQGPDARYLGPVTRDARGIVQRIELQYLLSEALCAQLYVQTEPPQP